jgi:hypothetical protein
MGELTAVRTFAFTGCGSVGRCEPCSSCEPFNDEVEAEKLEFIVRTDAARPRLGAGTDELCSGSSSSTSECISCSVGWLSGAGSAKRTSPLLCR